MTNRNLSRSFHALHASFSLAIIINKLSEADVLCLYPHLFTVDVQDSKALSNDSYEHRAGSSIRDRKAQTLAAFKGFFLEEVETRKE